VQLLQPASHQQASMNPKHIMHRIKSRNQFWDRKSNTK
jgi:hypothetical protein